MRLYVPTRDACSLVTEYDGVIKSFLEINRDQSAIGFVDSAEAADLIIVFEHFSFKLWDYKESLRECRLLNEFPDRVFTVNDDDLGRGYLPGCYTSLTTRNFDPNIHKACSYPVTYNEAVSQTTSNPSETAPPFLFSFCGTIRSHPVRKAILRELSGCEAGSIEYVDQMFHSHSDTQKRKFTERILESRFVLCPRGWSPSTYRLFEVMELGRCPVIISDEWVPIGGIAWEECSIRIRERDISRIPLILSERIADAELLGANARRVWEQNFSVENRNKYYLHSIIDLFERSRERGPISFADLYTRWSSWSFYWRNGWTIPQRARAKLDRTLRKFEIRNAEIRK